MNLNTIAEVKRPTSADQITQWRDGYAWLAGGTWLFSEPQVSTDTLIDLERLNWPALESSPAGLDIAAIDAGLVSGFLTHLEAGRGNTARTRNARLAAIRSFFKFAALRHPEHAGTIARVLAIPAKKHGRTSVSYLTAAEAAALLAAPDTTTWHGRRDRAFLALAAQTGLRSSELTGLTRGDVQTGTGPTVRCHGKGRKDRVTPLTANVGAVIRSWLREQPGSSADPLFPTRTGRRLSSDAVQDLVERHAATAAAGCPSMRDKHVTPHTLRHILFPLCTCSD